MARNSCRFAFNNGTSGAHSPMAALSQALEANLGMSNRMEQMIRFLDVGKRDLGPLSG